MLAGVLAITILMVLDIKALGWLTSAQQHSVQLSVTDQQSRWSLRYRRPAQRCRTPVSCCQGWFVWWPARIWETQFGTWSLQLTRVCSTLLQCQACLGYCVCKSHQSKSSLQLHSVFQRHNHQRMLFYNTSTKCLGVVTFFVAWAYNIANRVLAVTIHPGASLTGDKYCDSNIDWQQHPLYWCTCPCIEL